MDIHNHNLNIHYSIPENLWNALVEMFAQLPHYRGFTDGCPQWYGYDGKLIDYICLTRISLFADKGT